MRKNKFGLSRTISDTIKRTIRQRCGFGCVSCWCYIYEYEHIDPTFKEANKHEVDKITLLCWKCHNYVTKWIWSKAQVKNYDKNPKCLQDWNSTWILGFTDTHPIVFLGNNKIINIFNIITIDDKQVLKIEPPRDEWEPFLLSANFYNNEWKEILKIEKNELELNNENWDIETIWSTLILRKWTWKISLKLKYEWWDKIFIEKIDMKYKDSIIIWDSKSVFKVWKESWWWIVLMWNIYSWWNGIIIKWGNIML